MLATSLESASRVAINPLQECVSGLANGTFRKAPSSPRDLHMIPSLVSTLGDREMELLSSNTLSASSSFQTIQHPVSAEKSVLVLENLDDETRDAVIRLVWSKKRRTILRLE